MASEKDNLLKELKNFAPPERMKGYIHNKFKADTLTIYLWNIDLSESLYKSLSFLEITFRNALANAISKSFDLPNWPIQDRLLADNERKKILNVIEDLTTRGKIANQGKIIAELSFGFWTSLLDKRYEQVLWPKIIKAAFPNMPSKIRTRKTLSKRFNKIRLLRNRIFHFEPIWHWQDLKEQYEDLLDALYWIEPKAGDLLKQKCRFLRIYQNRPNMSYHKIKQLA